jgi:hypothetical protein
MGQAMLGLEALTLSALPALSCDTVSTRRPPAASLSSVGISITQGPHHVAQRLISTGLPLRSLTKPWRHPARQS